MHPSAPSGVDKKGSEGGEKLPCKAKLLFYWVISDLVGIITWLTIFKSGDSVTVQRSKDLFSDSNERTTTNFSEQQDVYRRNAFTSKF